MNKYCPKCKSSAFRDGNYCYVCGTKLVKEDGCSCGRSLASVDRYCSDCGAITDFGKKEQDELKSPEIFGEKENEDNTAHIDEYKAEVKAENDLETINGL